MNKIIYFLGISIILISTFLSGCQQQGTSSENNLDKNILFDSDIAELVYSKINFNKDDTGIILSIEVEYRFRNVVNRNIDIYVFAEFYDKDGGLLTKEGPKEIYIPKGWTEQGVSPANIIRYSGEKSSQVDFVKIVVEEKS